MTETAAFPAYLREATKTAHRLLDHHPLLAPLLTPTLTPTAYGQALAALHGAHGVIESTLTGFMPAAQFLPRLPDLASDLAALGISPWPVTVAIPQAASDAEKLGMLYVIEGSNLGGVVIAKQLATSLPPDVPRAFFGGAEGHPRWQRFWAFVQSRILPADFDRAARAASATFAFYRHHLDSCLDRV